MSVHFGQSGGSRHVPVLPGSKTRAPLRAPVPAPLPPPSHTELPPLTVPEGVKPRRKQRHRGSRLLCLLVFVAALTALAAGFLSRLYLSLDIFSNFTPQLAIVAGAFFIGFFLPWLRLTFVTVLILAGIAGLGVFARYESDRIAALPAYAAEAAESPLKLMSFNVHLSNTDWSAVANEVERQDPDVVTLIEFGPDKQAAADRLAQRYPYRAECMAVANCHMLLLSKIPISAVDVRGIWTGPPAIKVRLGGAFDGLNIIAVHTIRPPWYRAQRQQLDSLVAMLHEVEGRKIVMGDFNSTPFSRLNRQFSVSSGLNRITWLPSWPSLLALPQLAIDHIFLSPGLRVLKEPVIGESAGSDHYPVIATVGVPSN
jgi:endonuclease/exonuclease/phosphatase (EEP) superfamily protein YafD